MAYQPLHTSWGHIDERASAKPVGISLFWMGRIVDEKHHEPERIYEKPMFKESKDFSNLAEIPERVIPTRGQTGPDVNAPLTPLMPHIKRNKDNHLAMFLEDKTLHNKTLFTRIGLEGARFGEGADSDVGLLKKWKESNRTQT